MAELSQTEILRYARHLILPEVGLEGQRRLKDASVLLIGSGGLGSPIALYLAAAGIGRIGVVDYDVVEDSNLQRQVIHGTKQLGELKVESARQRMLEINPYIQVEVYNEVFSSDNAMRISDGYDILVDGTDNFPHHLGRYKTRPAGRILQPGIYYHPFIAWRICCNIHGNQRFS